MNFFPSESTIKKFHLMPSTLLNAGFKLVQSETLLKETELEQGPTVDIHTLCVMGSRLYIKCAVKSTCIWLDELINS